MPLEQVILRDIANKTLRRDDIAIDYAVLLTRCFLHRDYVDWHKVNQAIITRWSLSALEYIKHKAWKLDLEMRRNGIFSPCDAEVKK